MRERGDHLGEALDASLAHTPDLVVREYVEDGQQSLHREALAHHVAQPPHLERGRLNVMEWTHARAVEAATLEAASSSS